MKLYILFILFLSGFVYSQTPDLILDAKTTPESIDQLYYDLSACEDIIYGSDIEADIIKAYAKRVFINMFLIHSEIDSARFNGQGVIDSISNINNRVYDFYNNNIKTLSTENSSLFFHDLLLLFKDPKYNKLKNEIDDISNDYRSAFTKGSYVFIDLFINVPQQLTQIKEDIKIVKESQLQFNLWIQINNSGVQNPIRFDQTHFSKVDSIISICDNAISSFKNALNNFGHLQDGENTAADLKNSLKNGVTDMLSAMDNISDLFNSYPLNLFDIDNKWIADSKNFLNKFNDILDGKVFTFGGDNIVIRPVTLLNHSFEAWYEIFLGFYRTSNRYTYTFSGLFPNALPAVIVDKLKEDMIINLTDNEAEMKSRILQLKNLYAGMLSGDQENSTANFGMAFTQTYFYLYNLNDEIKDFVNYVTKGNFTNKFNFEVINDKAGTDSISNYFNNSCMDENFIFTILMVTGDNTQPYTINSSTKFIPVYITSSMLHEVKDISQKTINSVNNIKESFKKAYDDLDNMFNLNLDPNYLDFSKVKSPYDFILVLEKSNPNFLEINQYGIDQLKKLGSEIKDHISKYSADIKNLNGFMDSIAVYRKEYDIEHQDFRTAISNINDFAQEVNTDFQVPEAATVIDSIKVNLSAWFDNPPTNLLKKMEWFFDNDDATDNTLGGLFPNGFVSNIKKNDQSIPEHYSLSQNFPNPFNPSTTIEYELPSPGNVKICIYDITGRMIKELLNEEKNAGRYTIYWDGKNNNGITAASGTYFYSIQSGDFYKTCKMILLK